MTDPVAVSTRINSKPGKEERVRELLHSLVPLSRKEAGCISYDLHESEDRPGEFLIYSVWSSGTALDAHYKKFYLVDAFKLVNEILEGMPEITRWKRLH